MERKIKKIIAAYSVEPAAFWATYSVQFIIDTVTAGRIVIDEDCTRELNEVIQP